MQDNSQPIIPENQALIVGDLPPLPQTPISNEPPKPLTPPVSAPAPAPAQVQPQPITVESVLEEPKKKSPVIMIAIVLLLLALIAGGAYFFGKTYLNNKSDSSTLSTSSDAEAVLDEDIPPVFEENPSVSDWQLYTSTANNFQIKYPSGWRLVESDSSVGFGPKEIGQDVLWAINVYDKNQYSKDQITDEMGKQFSDRVQATKSVGVGTLTALELITATPSAPDWYLDTLLIELENSYITISNGAITNDNLQKMPGVLAGTTFENFYSTFKIK